MLNGKERRGRMGRMGYKKERERERETNNSSSLSLPSERRQRIGRREKGK